MDEMIFRCSSLDLKRFLIAHQIRKTGGIESRVENKHTKEFLSKNIDKEVDEIIVNLDIFFEKEN
jgi:hypothetical protein